MVEVTQDRKAAQELFDKALGDMASFAEFGSPSYQEAALRTITEAIAAVRIAERERCAGIVEARVEPSWHPAAKNGAKLIAQAIREQSNG